MFEGSFLGDKKKLKDDNCMECKICHYVYYPEKGDNYWQIDSGTPFARLPEYWSCPECDAQKHQFMVVERHELV